PSQSLAFRSQAQLELKPVAYSQAHLDTFDLRGKLGRERAGEARTGRLELRERVLGDNPNVMRGRERSGSLQNAGSRRQGLSTPVDGGDDRLFVAHDNRPRVQHRHIRVAGLAPP